MIKWYEAMSKYWKEVDLYGHLVTTSNYPFKQAASNPSVLVRGIDVGQVHDYVHIDEAGNTGGSMGPFLRKQLLEYRKMPQNFSFPLIYGEVGIYNGLRVGCDVPYDPHGVHLHNRKWSVAFALGSGSLFWYNDYVTTRHLWYHYDAFAKFVALVPWNSASLSIVADAEIHAADTSVVVRALQDRRVDKSWVWIRNTQYDAEWLRTHNGSQPSPILAGEVKVPCAEGGYLVIVFNTTDRELSHLSRENVECHNGKLVVAYQGFDGDVAAQATREGV